MTKEFSSNSGSGGMDRQRQWQQQTLLTLVPASVFRQLRDAGQVVALRLPERLPYAPLGMVLPLRDVAVATRTVADFLLAHCNRRP